MSLMKLNFLLLCSLVSLFYFVDTRQVSAQGLPFGGLVTTAIPCTCPGSIGNIWISYAPLYLGSPIPSTGSLVYVPYITRVFAWFRIGIPLIWHLGSYIPGVQACWMIVPPPAAGCVPLPAAGVISQMGTS